VENLINSKKTIIMRYLILLLIVFPFLFCISCKKDWLDKKPQKNLTTPATLDDCEALMDNEVFSASGSGVSEIASDGHYIPESFWASGLGDLTINAYTWTNDRPYVNVLDWYYIYQGILYTNITLEALAKIDPSGAERARWNSVKGNALFQRARFHFELSRTYSPPFVNGTEMMTPGIPLRLTANINEKSVKSSLKVVYERVIADLEEAIALVPAKAVYKTRASKQAIYAQLADVYLNMQNYGRAAEYADLSLKIDNIHWQVL
jgi:tetratricopeptide (TPR) repeat protein